MKKSITLIGMAGAGKTTIGKKLAKILSLNFLDGDKIIEGEKNLQKLKNLFCSQLNLMKLS